MERPQLPKHFAGKDWMLSGGGLSSGRNLLAMVLGIVALTVGLSSFFIFSVLAKSVAESILTRKGNGPSRTVVGAPTRTREISSAQWRTEPPMPAGYLDLVSALSSPRSVTCTTNPVVTSNADSGAGSLRQAILDACDGSTITFSSLFSSSQTITLTSQLLVDKSLTVTGPGANLLTVSGNNVVRVFSIATGSLNVTLTNLAIANGSSTVGAGIFNDSTGTLSIVNGTIFFNSASNGGGGKGGGVYNNSSGTVNITSSSISANSANNDGAIGGGIFNNSSGTVNITSSTVSGNSAHGNSVITSTAGSGTGGGIVNGPLGTVHITNSTVSSNTATGDGDAINKMGSGKGGGIYNVGTMSITSTTLSGNSATSTRNDSLCECGGSGGGIYNGGGSIAILNSILSSNSTRGNGYGGANGAGIYNSNGATINVTTSTVSGNSAQAGGIHIVASGAGISNGGTLTIISSTISGNSAFGSSGGASGGGVTNAGQMSVTLSYLSGNSAGGGSGSEGGGIRNGGNLTITSSTIGNNSALFGGGVTGGAIITNSIIASNTGSSSPPGSPDVMGTFTSNGYNLIGKSNGSTGFTNGINNDLVGSVASPIDPLLGGAGLLPGSPAIDKGSAVNGITTDIRGLTRPVDLLGYANAPGGNGSDIGAFEVQGGTPDHLKFNVQPSNIVAGGTITPAISVTILDGSNNATTTTADVTVAVGTNPSGGTLGGTLTVTAVNGTATFSDLTVNKSGVGYTLMATSSSLLGATSNAFTVSCPTITLAPLSLPHGTLGFSYTNNVTASGGTASFSFAVTSGSVPTGLTFNGDGTWSGTPSASGTFNFTITATAASGCVASQAYTVLINALTISGRVTKGGNGFSGVTMTLSGGQSNSTLTDANGNYSFGNIAGNANYTVTPFRSNHAFVPPNATFNNLQGNGTADFVGTLINYTISGRVTVGACRSQWCDNDFEWRTSWLDHHYGNGNYAFVNVAGDGNYSVTPSLTGYHL